jgi:hypothetical protein
LFIHNGHVPSSIINNTKHICFTLRPNIDYFNFPMLLIGAIGAYIFPNGETVQCAEIIGLHVLPEVSRVYAAQQEIIILASRKSSYWPAENHHSNVTFCRQDCSDGTTGIPRHLMEVAT